MCDARGGLTLCSPNNQFVQVKLQAAEKSQKCCSPCTLRCLLTARCRMMETEKDTRRVRKNCQQGAVCVFWGERGPADHALHMAEGYLARKNSISSIQQLSSYVNNDDDDEGDSRCVWLAPLEAR